MPKASNPDLSLFLDILLKLEALEILYMIIGGFAAIDVQKNILAHTRLKPRLRTQKHYLGNIYEKILEFTNMTPQHNFG